MVSILWFNFKEHNKINKKLGHQGHPFDIPVGLGRTLKVPKAYFPKPIPLDKTSLQNNEKGFFFFFFLLQLKENQNEIKWNKKV